MKKNLHNKIDNKTKNGRGGHTPHIATKNSTNKKNITKKVNKNGK